MKKTEVIKLLDEWQEKLDDGKAFIKDYGYELVIGDGDKDIIVHRSNGDETSSYVFEMSDEESFKADDLSEDEERKLLDFLACYLYEHLSLRGI